MPHGYSHRIHPGISAIATVYIREYPCSHRIHPGDSERSGSHRELRIKNGILRVQKILYILAREFFYFSQFFLHLSFHAVARKELLKEEVLFSWCQQAGAHFANSQMYSPLITQHFFFFFFLEGGFGHLFSTHRQHSGGIPVKNVHVRKRPCKSPVASVLIRAVQVHPGGLSGDYVRNCVVRVAALSIKL